MKLFESNQRIKAYRSIGEDEFRDILEGKTIQGRFDSSSETQTNSDSKDVVYFFVKPVMWKDKSHKFMIECEFDSSKVENTSGVYYASKDLEKTNIWTGRRGNVEYNFDEVIVKEYSLKDVTAIISEKPIEDLLNDYYADWYANELMDLINKSKLPNKILSTLHESYLLEKGGAKMKLFEDRQSLKKEEYLDRYDKDTEYTIKYLDQEQKQKEGLYTPIKNTNIAGMIQGFKEVTPDFFKIVGKPILVTESKKEEIRKYYKYADYEKARKAFHEGDIETVKELIPNLDMKEVLQKLWEDQDVEFKNFIQDYMNGNKITESDNIDKNSLTKKKSDSLITFLIDDEKEAIEGYNKFLSEISEKLDSSLYKTIEKTVNHIIEEEEHHIEELKEIDDILNKKLESRLLKTESLELNIPSKYLKVLNDLYDEGVITDYKHPDEDLSLAYALEDGYDEIDLSIKDKPIGDEIIRVEIPFVYGAPDTRVTSNYICFYKDYMIATEYADSADLEFIPETDTDLEESESWFKLNNIEGLKDYMFDNGMA